MHMNLHVHDSHKHVTATPLWVTTGYVPVGKGHMILHHSTSIDWFPSVPVWWNRVEHSFTINSVIWGYHVYKMDLQSSTVHKELENIVILVMEVAMKRATLRATASVVSRHINIPHFMSAICSIFYVKAAPSSVAL